MDVIKPKNKILTYHDILQWAVSSLLKAKANVVGWCLPASNPPLWPYTLIKSWLGFICNLRIIDFYGLKLVQEESNEAMKNRHFCFLVNKELPVFNCLLVPFCLIYRNIFPSEYIVIFCLPKHNLANRMLLICIGKQRNEYVWK